MSDAAEWWETTVAAERSALQKKQDVLFLFVHWMLRQMRFKCHGLAGKTENAQLSEVLPDKWNEKYSVRYDQFGVKYDLFGIFTGGSGVFNLLNKTKNDVASVGLKIDYVASMEGSIETMIPTYKDLMQEVKTKLLKNIYVSTSATTQTDAEEESKADPLMNPKNAEVSPLRDLRDHRNLIDPLRVGEGDLNPFGLGGGMIFNPNGGLEDDFPGRAYPRGRFPGARYDPLGPPGMRGIPGQGGIFRPPRFDDDMFS